MHQVYIRRDGKEIVQVIEQDGQTVILENQNGTIFKTTYENFRKHYVES